MLNLVKNMTDNLSREQLLMIVVASLIVIGYGMYLLHGCWNKSEKVGTDRTLMAYNEHFSNNKTEFIMFYVDWCGHCKNTKPEFQKLMDAGIQGVDIKMLNAEKEGEERAKEMKVEGYPTIVLVKEDGSTQTCNAERNVESWKAWVEERVQ